MRLQDWRWITIEPIDKAATQVDGLSRHPEGFIARKTAIVVKAEILKAEQTIRFSAGGVGDYNSSAKIIVRRRDAEKKNWVPQMGDLISEVEDREHRAVDVRFFVIGVDENPWLRKNSNYILSLSDDFPKRHFSGA